jgi:hypothetical protein
MLLPSGAPQKLQTSSCCQTSTHHCLLQLHTGIAQSGISLTLILCLVIIVCCYRSGFAAVLSSSPRAPVSFEARPIRVMLMGEEARVVTKALGNFLVITFDFSDSLVSARSCNLRLSTGYRPMLMGFSGRNSNPHGGRSCRSQEATQSCRRSLVIPIFYHHRMMQRSSRLLRV